MNTITGTAVAETADATLVSIDNLELINGGTTVVARVVWEFDVTAAIATEHNLGNNLSFNDASPTGPSTVHFASWTGLWHYDTDAGSYAFSADSYDVTEAASTQTEADSIDGTVASGGEVQFLGIGYGDHSGSIATLTGTWTGEDAEEATLTRSTSGSGQFAAARLAASASTGAAETGTFTLDTAGGFPGDNIDIFGVFSFILGEGEVEVGSGVKLNLSLEKMYYAELPYQLHTRML